MGDERSLDESRQLLLKQYELLGNRLLVRESLNWGLFGLLLGGQLTLVSKVIVRRGGRAVVCGAVLCSWGAASFFGQEFDRIEYRCQLERQHANIIETRLGMSQPHVFSPTEQYPKSRPAPGIKFRDQQIRQANAENLLFFFHEALQRKYFLAKPKGEADEIRRSCDMSQSQYPPYFDRYLTAAASWIAYLSWVPVFGASWRAIHLKIGPFGAVAATLLCASALLRTGRKPCQVTRSADPAVPADLYAAVVTEADIAGEAAAEARAAVAAAQAAASKARAALVAANIEADARAFVAAAESAAADAGAALEAVEAAEKRASSVRVAANRSHSEIGRDR